MKLYGEISKTEELDDGTIKVWGYASTESVDSDGETVTSEAMKAALPDYMKFGAVREMHQAKAAGTAIEANVEEDGRTYFGAHVVDSEAVKKVKAGVYKGFSIGGKVTERDELNKSVIKGIKLVEVSLVDRPANPEAVFTCYKAETIEEAPAIDQLAEMLNKGEITPERLIELAKASKVEEPKEEEIKKGMWSLSDFAQVLSSIGCMCQDAQSESDWEGDNSPIPAQLRDWFAQGMQIFKDMAAEETAELLASLKAQAGEVEVIQMSEKGGDLAKSGSKFSKDSKDKLAKAHKAVKDANDHLASLGYDSDDGKDDDNDDDDKNKSAQNDDLAKVSADLDLVKADLAKVSQERDDLAKRVKELEAKPAPGKALLKAVGKTDDLGDKVIEGGVVKVEPVKEADGNVNEVATLIKSVHRGVGASRL